ncbi:MAG: hypothetical protein AVDCRST_MAG77-1140 [uncultured Chloroflexi bacterium]|uniref:Uncharacterized protein n=1 Tax=uncultured Chloroflexota bacterium TaxID=166587 RepID=A0A6J4HTP1_9CHLR|nr:MAG: hypothetical protein AVDCRST_MAG77-1140 [uncultured Chloroflexota bacterium]
MKSGQRRTKFLSAVVSAGLLVSLLNPTAAFAQGKGNGNGGGGAPAASQPAPKQEPAKAEAPKQEAPKPAPAPAQQPKQDAPKQEAPKQEAPKPAQAQQPKQEAPKPAQVQQQPKQEAPKPAQAPAQQPKQDDKPQIRQELKNTDAGLPGGTMGKSGSNPDGGELDKPIKGDESTLQGPIGADGILDGNNGCGQDKRLDSRRELSSEIGDKQHIGYDDNNGWCGKQPENEKPDNDKPSQPNNDKPGNDKPDVVTPEQPKTRTTTFDVNGCYVPVAGADRTARKIHEQNVSETRYNELNAAFDEVDMSRCQGTLGVVDQPDQPEQPKAPKVDQEKVWVCHRTGSARNP